MLNQRSFLRIGIVFFSMVFILASFGTVFAKEKKEIVIGTHLSMTGMLAMAAKEQAWAYEQATADVNKKGGIFVKELGKKLPVKLIVVDDESDPGKAAAAVEKLIKLQKVDLILSGHSTPLTIPSMVTSEKYKKYYHGTACLIPVWAHQKFKWSTMFFINMPTFADALYNVIKSLPVKIERPALLMEDTLDGRGLGGGLRHGAEAFGFKLAVDEPWAVGAKDYSSQILKLKAKKADAVMIFGSPADTVTFIRQMKENDVSVKYFHGYKGTWTAEFKDAMGKDAQYVMCDGFWSETYPYPGAKELGARYTKEFNKQSVSTGAFYATAQILYQAIERAGSLESAKVRDAVIGGEFKGTVMGDVKYGPDGSAGFQIGTFQWWNGKQRQVYPFFKDSWKTKVMTPWDKR
ncbi:MAG: amino acid ABC transporter substrate-binding protein [Deltaproteobacteria bacterium]|nr:amino acid ABC transporter substrate-binding protein [Deltaproteobacteria bacterium]